MNSWFCYLVQATLSVNGWVLFSVSDLSSFSLYFRLVVACYHLTSTTLGTFPHVLEKQCHIIYNTYFYFSTNHLDN